MSALSPVNWKVFERFLFFVGCTFKRQEGDHRVYWRAGLKRPVILPTYKSLPLFVIRNNLRTLGISVEEYLAILKQI